MWRILGHTNYECTEGPEQDLGTFNDFDSAVKAFVSMTQDARVLDFSILDDQLDEWMKDPDWRKDIYYGGFYGGTVNLYDNDRLVLQVSFARDPYSKLTNVGEFEFGTDFNEEEKNTFLFALQTSENQ